MRPRVAHAHLSLGRLCRRLGHRGKAQEHLGAASALFREMEMPVELAEAESALRNLGRRIGGPPG